MPVFIKILLSFLLICFSSTDIVFAKDSLVELLPKSVEGWRITEAPQVYNRENLFDYINGGAEIYLAYGFQQLVVQRYAPELKDTSEEKSITIGIWQMDSSSDAYGIFSLDQEGESVDIGQEGVYSYGLLRFWKGEFFVEILGLGDNLKKIILKLGTEIDKKIKKEGELPQLVSKLPTDSLILGSVCFFHRQIILKNLYFFPEQNLLNLNEKTDCVLADYSLSNDSLKLLLIQYPDAAKAKDMQDSLKKIYLQNQSSADDNIFETKEEKLLGMDSVGNYLILIFEGKDRKNILWLLNSVQKSLNLTER